MNVDKLTEAFASVKTKVKLGEKMNGRPNLLTHSTAAICANFPDRAANLQHELLALRQKPENEESPHELMQLGDKMKASGQLHSAVLTYYKAAKQFDKTNSEMNAKDILQCFTQADNSIAHMLSSIPEVDVNKKDIDKLATIVEDFLVMLQKSKFQFQVLILVVSMCYYTLCNLYNICDEYEKSLDRSMEGLKYMESKLPSKYQTFVNYANLHYQRAMSFMNTHQYDDALEHTELAAAAYHKAEDYKDTQHRIQEIAIMASEILFLQMREENLSDF